MSLKLPVTQNDDEIGTITVSMDMEPMTGVVVSLTRHPKQSPKS
jgi:hypothetical protein